ncbi:hypothetical protein PanWU01x14_355910 [Parasponia andersonii]|uniref:Uncharacterized protein n=1 Tax=Parasponia andersonii TaxID=3476 RepID=A0A2P5A934_PARAD|nr:hypothetical protein PanWU01x14_355910 [Parasponia andersonii]
MEHGTLKLKRSLVKVPVNELNQLNQPSFITDALIGLNEQNVSFSYHILHFEPPACYMVPPRL